ncbi:MAG: hypothetical protein CFE26_15585, partial [Verrucomicrobiales bacterium VVV1]
MLACVLTGLGQPVLAAPCPGPVLRFVALAPGHWLVPAADGDATAANRGQVSNLLLVREDGATPR